MATYSVGIDIGSKSIKLIELMRQKSQFTLSAMGEIPVPFELLKASNDDALASFSLYIKKLFKDSGCHIVDVCSALPSEKVSTAFIDIPIMPDKELEYAMQWEIRKHVVDYSEDKSATWDIVAKNEKFEVMIASTPKYIISRYLNTIKNSGLNPISLEIEPISLNRSLIEKDHSGVTAIIHIGVSFSVISIVENGVTRSIKNVKIGENEMLFSMASFGKEDYTRNLLYNFGILKSKDQGKIHNIIKPIIEVIAFEFERLSKYYQEKSNKEINRVLISGGCSQIPNIADLMSPMLSTEVSMGNAWQNINFPNNYDVDELTKVGPRFAVAVGLAMTQ
ncbi:hypothetical protein COX95_01040 [bacterium CG_4_10_14_0_2_um_filter_33_32]|nr:MAG: hypothetical protein AUJ93_01415 [bacterium CG2_30_33_46]PIR67172.1 MAG: hypothetical protein COU50_04665 [bacterium CG10_big_fil_rev_8_21_14_0_10_33_18]PIW80728.1 MAG: hypothetical protein COZ97_04690 [bacterium CG_4_8_14_3_um_filter_33_28]PIY85372.1 MAG: hypothetical protein COY76_02495 [bacterium CG_4_10_14_0_8_um_filter_33_57]PIZ86518.1 MAG: hypothetical protein COX95_01040 [bacterium CG_4_10_14_0_2_um_filter_33_32]PJA72193.1 MAG: hypothetical protein CO152_02710 [bacterium CG_4_9_